MKRSKALEKAVRDLLDLYGIEYVRVENYRCFKCGQVQNSKASGFPDFLCLSPFFAIECKTGSGRLSPKQKDVKGYFEAAGIDYLVVRDNIDTLIDYLEGKI